MNSKNIFARKISYRVPELVNEKFIQNIRHLMRQESNLTIDINYEQMASRVEDWIISSKPKFCLISGATKINLFFKAAKPNFFSQLLESTPTSSV